MASCSGTYRNHTKEDNMASCSGTLSITEEDEMIVRVTEIITKFREKFKIVDELKNYDLKDFSNNMLMFIGNTGAGKSTLVQLLVDGDLSSAETFLDSGEYIVINSKSNDSKSTIVSDTLYPEVYRDENNEVCFCDNPGFNDTRSSIHEVAATYAMKKVISHFKNIKLVLVVNRTSLQKGMYRNEFMDVLRHVTNFVKDIDNYKNCIYLVATKVDNVYKIKSGQPTLVEDNVVIGTIADFLAEIVETIKKRMTEITEEEERSFYERSLKIVKSILSKNDKYTYDRISIFRKPNQSGLIVDIPILMTEKENIKKMLMDKRSFAPIDDNSFGYSISYEAILYLIEIFEDMNDHVTYIAETISKIMAIKIKDTFKRLTNLSSTIKSLLKFKFEIGKITEKTRNCKTPNEFLSALENNEHIKDINSLNIHLSELKEINTRLKYFENVTDRVSYRPDMWSAKLEFVQNLIDNELLCFRAVDEIFKKLAHYKVQNQKSLYNVENINDWGSKDKKQGLQINEGNIEKFFEKNNLPLVARFNTFTILNKVIDITLKGDTIISIDANDLLIVGSFVRSNEIVQWLQGKDGNNFDRIIIISKHTFYIDADLKDEKFKGKELLIIAPVWVIITDHWSKTRQINVDGQSGSTKAEASASARIDGMDGNDGGKFTGIGMKFANPQCLEISACGGKGQDGKNGQNGKDGIVGADARENDDGILKDEWRFISLIYNRKTIQTLNTGQRGSAGTNGTKGGKGGKGGIKGNINIYSLDLNFTKVNKISEDGATGKNGEDGKPGKGGHDGKGAVVNTVTHNIFGLFEWHSDKEIIETIESKTYEEGRLEEYQQSQEKGKSGSVSNRFINNIFGVFDQPTDFLINRKESIKDVENVLGNKKSPKTSTSSNRNKHNSTIEARPCMFKDYFEKEFVHSFLPDRPTFDSFLSEAHKIWYCDCKD